MVNTSYLLIGTVAQPAGCPGSSVHGLRLGPCKRQEGDKGGRSGAAAEVGRERERWSRLSVSIGQNKGAAAL